MRLKAHGSTVLILLTLAAAGCDGNRTAAIPTGPTAGPTAPVPVAVPTVAVGIEGRVIDGDSRGAGAWRARDRR